MRFYVSGVFKITILHLLETSLFNLSIHFVISRINRIFARMVLCIMLKKETLPTQVYVTD